MVYHRDTPKMHLRVDTETKVIRISQRWHYEWISEPPNLPWTIEQQELYHSACRRIIWNGWSNQFRLRLTDPADARMHVNVNHNHEDVYSVVFHISYHQESNYNFNWLVKVSKGLENIENGSVDWEYRIITLYAEDINKQFFFSGNLPFNVVFHEFGHTLQQPDEYGIAFGNAEDPIYMHDLSSVMNIGNELRIRHINFVLSELNQMVPNRRFILRPLD